MEGFISSSYTDELWTIYEDIYDLKALKFDDLTMLCAVWFTFSVLRDLFLKPWADQH